MGRSRATTRPEKGPRRPHQDQTLRTTTPLNTGINPQHNLTNRRPFSNPAPPVSTAPRRRIQLPLTKSPMMSPALAEPLPRTHIPICPTAWSRILGTPGDWSMSVWTHVRHLFASGETGKIGNRRGCDRTVECLAREISRKAFLSRLKSSTIHSPRKNSSWKTGSFTRV